MSFQDASLWDQMSSSWGKPSLPTTIWNDIVGDGKKHPGVDSFKDYIDYTTPDYEFPKHIMEGIDSLEAVERGEITRLMLTLPVRHGKSTLVNRFITWYLGRHPDRQVIHASAVSDLVTDFGRRIRNTIVSEEHLEVFPSGGISKDSRAAGKFDMGAGGIYIAAGVGGAIQGRGGDLIVADDVHKGRQMADSETDRKRVIDWYMQDLYPRKLPGAAIVVIGSRWREDDLPGYLLDQQKDGGDEWTLLNAPALDEEGNALWPERYSAEELQQIKRNVGPRAWQALYQGSPTPDTGGYFNLDWLREGVLPSLEEMAFYTSLDQAVSEGAGDYTVIATVGVDKDSRIWLVDLWRRQADTSKWIPALADTIDRWKPSILFEEAGGIAKMTNSYIAKELLDRGLHVKRELVPSTTNLEARSRPLQALMAAKGVWLDHHALFRSVVEAELASFPVGAHDDIVSALSMLGRNAHKLTPPREDEKVDKALNLDFLWQQKEKGRA